jgi:hypothetical protein
MELRPEHPLHLAIVEEAK